jgi:hypothetical protein
VQVRHEFVDVTEKRCRLKTQINQLQSGRVREAEKSGTCELKVGGVSACQQRKWCKQVSVCKLKLNFELRNFATFLSQSLFVSIRFG